MKFNLNKISFPLLAVLLILFFNNSKGDNKFTFSDINDLECLSGNHEKIKDSKFLIVTKINIDCSSCLKLLIEWNKLLKQINLCPMISFVVIGYGEHKLRFQYLLSEEFKNINYPILYSQKALFDEDLILINKKNKIICLNSPFINKVNQNRFISIIKDKCSYFKKSSVPPR